MLAGLAVLTGVVCLDGCSGQRSVTRENDPYFGGTGVTPIVDYPVVAILGLVRSSTEPVWINGKFEPRLVLPLSLSYDHRVIDGASGARFISFLASVLVDIRKLVL